MNVIFLIMWFTSSQGYLSFSWTDSICVIRLLCVVALYSHWLQGMRCHTVLRCSFIFTMITRVLTKLWIKWNFPFPCKESSRRVEKGWCLQQYIRICLALKGKLTLVSWLQGYLTFSWTELNVKILKNRHFWLKNRQIKKSTKMSTRFII